MTMRYFQDAAGQHHGFDSALPSDLALMEALAIHGGWHEVTGAWPPNPTLAQVKEEKKAAIRASCEAALLEGFLSSATGSECGYPSQDVDQRNLLNAALTAQGQPQPWEASLWCCTGDKWSLVKHSADQVLQVNTDWLNYRQLQQGKYASLLLAVNDATELDAVAAIAW